MDKNELIEKFYQAVANTLEKNVQGETTLKGDLGLNSAGYYMIIAEMEELGADEVTYGMLRKCEKMSDVAAILVDQLED